MEVLNTIDWRRRTFALYAEVRAIADPADAHAHWCNERQQMFLTHPASAAAVQLEVAPYDAAWRFEVAIQDAAPASFDYETGTDGLVTFDRVGVVSIPNVGELDVWRHTGYGGGIFLPIRDTSPDTYGGGRYLLDTIKGADLGFSEDSLVLDLNFAYNPSCAYDPAWACPLAPPGDRVTVPIPVGERYHGEH
ncbi:MAG: DUF1684 domain-containing protein [Pseudolysinimonas sp.]